ncbi:inositol monophosphatase [Bosea sp. 2KB_26]|uniref:inositol monophosphatase family protein n=1 Tax=Bosea sp. 2KB_26 TaxID=3237475 RepID=UPI003F8E21EF
MNDIPLDRYLAFARAVCAEAGEILLDYRQRGALTVDSKAGFELVTSADLAIDQHIARRVAEVFKEHALLSEESSQDVNLEASACWIVDPLDGTANFVHGHDHVAISMALAISGVISLGVVHAPFQQQTFWAVRGEGAFRNGTRIAASTLTDVRRALIATGFPHQRSEIDLLVDRLKPLLREFGDIRRLAAPALDICWVADGRLAGFVDRIHKWDIAAAGLIATEAGARVIALEAMADRGAGDGADYIVAAPGIFDRLCDVMSHRHDGQERTLSTSESQLIQP